MTGRTWKKKRPPRIFAGLAEICGYSSNLREGFAELGISLEVVTMYPDPYVYNSGDSTVLARFARTAYERRTSTPRSDLLSKIISVSYTHLRAHETGRNLVCRLLLEK